MKQTITLPLKTLEKLFSASNSTSEQLRRLHYTLAKIETTQLHVLKEIDHTIAWKSDIIVNVKKEDIIVE